MRKALSIFVLLGTLAFAHAGDTSKQRLWNFRLFEEKGSTRVFQLEYGAPPEKELKEAGLKFLKAVAGFGDAEPKLKYKEEPGVRSFFYVFEAAPGKKLPLDRLYSMTLLGCDKSGDPENQWWEYELVLRGGVNKETKDFVKGFMQPLLAAQEKVDPAKLRIRTYWKEAQPSITPAVSTVKVIVVRE